MTNFKKIIVALDFSATDEKLLYYSQLIASKCQTEKAYFVHVEQNLAVPSHVLMDYEEMIHAMEPTDELIKQKLSKSIEAVYKQFPNLEMEVELLEGKPLEELVHWAKVKKADLVILGNKKTAIKHNVQGRKIARELKCPVLFVPEMAVPVIERIVVPLDFSDYSLRALQTALEIAAQRENAEVVGVHVYDVPTVNYYYIDTYYDKFLTVIKQRRQKEYFQFLEENNIDGRKIQMSFVENVLGNIPLHIYRHAQSIYADLIITGAKGHSRFDSIVFGSVTEQLVEYSKEMPLLVVR